VVNNSDGLIEEIVLGDLTFRAIPWVEVTYSFEREGITNNHSLTLRVRIRPEFLPPGLTWKKEPLWVAKEIINGHKFASPSMNDSEEVVFQSFKKLAEKLAPSFYEIDPRIGLSFAGETFPNSPLFDPPLNIRRPSTGFHHYRKTVDWAEKHRLPLTSAPASAPTVDNCALCQESVIQSPDPETIVWGGGNVGWVHLECAPWIEDRKTQRSWI